MRMSGTFERRETAWRWPLLLPVPDLRSVAQVALRGPPKWAADHGALLLLLEALSKAAARLFRLPGGVSVASG